MTEKKIYKPKAISGFPEWLPEYRRVEQQWLDHIRKTFESYGYTNIETPVVEELDVLTAKGEVDKEIYVIERLHKDENDKSEARLALHFDQTVPFARYVAQHFGDLNFPFKRYQMQKVWRGERPQLGRMREFYQCDIDVIGIDNLPLHFDAEMPAVIYECLMGLNIGRVQIRISNRKIITGYLESIGINNIEDQKIVLHFLDKLEKMQDWERLDAQEKLTTDLCHGSIEMGKEIYKKLDTIRSLIDQKYTNASDIISSMESNPEINTSHPILKEGINELSVVMERLNHLPEHAVVADLSIVRGLDYYTGTVYETRLLDVPDFTSSIVSGGRYDDLAGSYINKHLPGVGISIGLSRLFDVLKNKGIVKPGPKCPTDVLVVLPSDERRADAAQTAQSLRARGYNVELFHKPAKTGDQIKYANNKGIPFVWLPPFETGGTHAVKTMASGEQVDNVDPKNWTMPV